MQLKFRGVSYDYQPVSLRRESLSEIGKYRGLKCVRALYRPEQLTQPSHRLTYRGVEYRSGQVESVQRKSVSVPTVNTPVAIADMPVAATSEPQSSRVTQTPVRSSRHQKLSDLEKIHNTYILQKLEQRLTAAKTIGNQDLIQLLEQEKTELV